MQDAPACLHWSRIRSADARACVSLCRPLGTTVHKRQLPRNAGVLPCMPHQAGKTVHAPLRLEQDVARGMLTGVVAKDSFTKEMFDLRPEEPAALEHVLPWLLNHNPWLGAYSTSLREVHTGLEQLRAEMQSAGRLLPGGFEGVQASDGKPLHEHLDQEVVAQLLPIDPLRSLTGSYQHLRAMATAICTSSLQQQLPPAWQQLQENPINDEGGHSIQPVPAFLGDNKSLTNVSFLDSHVEAKLFVDKFRHGTGSFRSTLDCINLRQHYRRGRMWSLDGEFICEEDPSWIFWQREHEIKMRLWEDWRGKHFGVPKPAASAVAPATFSPPSSVRHEAAYSKAMFSQRVGSLIPDSAQALSRTKFEWLEAARPENLGPPTGMTTFVGHPTAAPIIAHALQGPCANPDPESSVNFLWPGRPKISSTGHVAIKSAEYLRRRTDFEIVAFGAQGRDALHGQNRHWCRRGESQKKGDGHDHINIWQEPCCFPAHAKEMEALAQSVSSNAAHVVAPTQPTLSEDAPLGSACRVVSRFCNRTGPQCVLPQNVRESEFHSSCHHAYAQAELTRPFPLGHRAPAPPRPPDLQNEELLTSRCRLQSELFSRERDSEAHLHPARGSLDAHLFEALAASTLFPAKLHDKMFFGDVISAYYYRALQISKFIHFCKLGYCRQSWADLCRFNLPAPEVQLVQVLDEATNRLNPARSYLLDDAYVKVHILSFLVRTLCNVQTNIHHPLSSINSLGYSIKYQLKPEPIVFCQQQHPADDSVNTYLKGQFVSLFSSCLWIQGDPPTHATFRTCLALPSWDATSGNREWKNYTHRLYIGEPLQPRLGWPLTVSAAALEVSLLFAKFQTLARYFTHQETTRVAALESADVAQGATSPEASTAQEPPVAESSIARAQGLSFKTWDSIPDQVTHPFYDLVLSMILPGDALQLVSERCRKRDVLRRVHNKQFCFGRFIWHDMSFLKDSSGRTNRSRHFETRLFAYLPWTVTTTCRQEVELDSGPALLTPINKSIRSFLGNLPVNVRHVPDDAGLVDYLYIDPAVWKLEPHPSETLCIDLERFFHAGDLCCACCILELPLRCDYCQKAVGWHRCRRRAVLDGPDAFAWSQGTLWKSGVEDIFACVVRMLQDAAGHHKIMAMLDSLRSHEALSEIDHDYLRTYVLQAASKIVDDDPMHPLPSQLFVLSHSAQKRARASPEALQAKVEHFQTRMGSLWSESAHAYLPWRAVRPAKPPSQLLAFTQLKYRFEHRQSIAVCIFASAGYGKTEISAAWLCHMDLNNAIWASSAPTGVAATQVAGCTLHSLTMMSLDGVSTLGKDPARLKAWCETSGLLLDEGFMIAFEHGDALLKVCQEHPLRMDLRGVVGAPDLAITGYRHMLIFGDIRQLPPASGSRPFWSTALFRNLFEVFVLREDRRHEKDPDMRRLKELLAWGGSEPTPAYFNSDLRPVDPQVSNFVLEGYLRGVGLTGGNVDLDVGTAFFPRKVDVRSWNAGCINQINETYGDDLEAVDVLGYDWRSASGSNPQQSQSRRLQGIQSPEILQLRTCPGHRQRVMVLVNQDVGRAWANGTRSRLLSQRSWTGKPRQLSRDPDGKYVAEIIALEHESSRDFQVHVVKDESCTIHKNLRFDPFDIQSISAKNEEGSAKRVAWRQVQLMPSYALTVHKCQGLTEYKAYPALTMTFGFGLPYTMCTRTPWQHNMWFVGVPPRDIFLAMFSVGADGCTLVSRKREEVEAFLQDPVSIPSLVQARIRSGEYILQEMSCAPDQSIPTLESAVRKEMQDWHQRLDEKSALRAMCEITYGFKVQKPALADGSWVAAVTTHASASARWPCLQQVLQGDDENRVRLQYYWTITRDWFESDAVDVLAHATLDEPCFSKRECEPPTPMWLQQAVLGTEAQNGFIPRKPFPVPPDGFVWECGFKEAPVSKKPPMPATDDAAAAASTPSMASSHGVDDKSLTALRSNKEAVAVAKLPSVIQIEKRPKAAKAAPKRTSAKATEEIQALATFHRHLSSSTHTSPISANDARSPRPPSPPPSKRVKSLPSATSVRVYPIPPSPPFVPTPLQTAPPGLASSSSSLSTWPRPSAVEHVPITAPAILTATSSPCTGAPLLLSAPSVQIIAPGSEPNPIGIAAIGDSSSGTPPAKYRKLFAFGPQATGLGLFHQVTSSEAFIVSHLSHPARPPLDNVTNAGSSRVNMRASSADMVDVWRTPLHNTATLPSHIGRALYPRPRWFNRQASEAVQPNGIQSGATCGLHVVNHILASASKYLVGLPDYINKTHFEQYALCARIGDLPARLMQPGGSNYDFAVLQANLNRLDILMFLMTPFDLEGGQGSSSVAGGGRLETPFRDHITANGVFRCVGYVLRLPSYGGHWIAILPPSVAGSAPLLCDSMHATPFVLRGAEVQELLMTCALDAAHSSVNAFEATWGCFLAAVAE